MARRNQEAIDTFMSITGATEAVAVRRLEDHGGDLNQAVNAHFTEGDSNFVREASISAPQNDFMDIDPPLPFETQQPPFPLLSAPRTIEPFSFLDATMGRSLFEGRAAHLLNRGPVISHPREVREIPIEVKDDNQTSGHSGRDPRIEDVSGSVDPRVPESHGAVIIDDDEEEEENNIATTISQAGARDSDPRPVVVQFDLPDYSNDIEEEMVRAAIEASKQEVRETYPNQHEDLADSQTHQRQSHLEDPELAHAVSLSMKTAEEEKVLRGRTIQFGVSGKEALKPSEVKLGEMVSSNGRIEVGSSSMVNEAEDEEPLVRHRTETLPLGSSESTKDIRGSAAHPPTSAERPDAVDRTRQNENGFPEEWGGISSEEHDEAVMLEAAMFGGIPEATGYPFPYAPHQYMGPEGPYPRRAPRPPSPSLTAQRLIREQQDDEYLASLQADREKELKAQEEAEARCLAEEAARQAVVEEEQRKEEERRRNLEEEQEFERKLAAKEASLPEEPAPDDENSITLVVRMADGSRRGRRFHKSDRLQFLFDFVDIGRGVKPGSYRLVRPYPRRAFCDEENAMTIYELGLTSKQEALFLESI